MSQVLQNPLRFVARVGIEFETPFIIGGGSDDLFFDDVFVADVNGLPALPGSSLAGILRHAWVEAGHGDGNGLFGYQKGDKGQGSRLSVSWGCIHGSQNRPVEGILYDHLTIATDPVLSEARLMSARDHVRINHKGTAADRGKFDERSVSAGHRFTFELLLEGTKDDQENWNKLLTLLLSKSIRIGGKTRRGYGQFKVNQLQTAAFDLSTLEGFSAFCAHPVALAAPCKLPDQLSKITPHQGKGSVSAVLHLKPESFWMIGGGVDSEVDMAPLKANRIHWENGKGKVVNNQVVVPGSSVKGVIAHRVAFHYNRLCGRFAEEVNDPATVCGENNAAVRALFGYCKTNEEKGDRDTGQRGRVIIGDIFVDQPGEQKILNHVSIDRFTGGARVLEGALFDEKPFYGGPGFKLQVAIVEPEEVTDAKMRKAFAAALEDLAQGRLAIGAGAGRGNGYFRAEGGVTWDEGSAAWIAGGV